MGLLQSILDFVIGLFMMAIGFYILKIFNGIAFALWAYTAPPPSSVVSVTNGISTLGPLLYMHWLLTIGFMLNAGVILIGEAVAYLSRFTTPHHVSPSQSP